MVLNPNLWVVSQDQNTSDNVQTFPDSITTKSIPPPPRHPYTNLSSQQPGTQTGRPTMRGARPTKTIEEAQQCAEKMGYHWTKNTDPALRFDAFIFREFVISAITIKKIRHAIDENTFVEKVFPDEVEALRSLPLPLNVLRKLWMRTQKRAGMAPVLYLLRIPPERSASTGERVT